MSPTLASYFRACPETYLAVSINDAGDFLLLDPQTVVHRKEVFLTLGRRVTYLKHCLVEERGSGEEPCPDEVPVVINDE